MLLKTGACFTAELELNCPTIVACVAALPVGAPAVAGDLVLGPDNQYHALPAAPVPNGSETKVVAGTNTTVTGSGTTASPYIVSAAAAAVPDGSETKVTGGANVTITGAGTVASPYVVAAVAGAIPDGSETKVVAGANTTVTGAGTTASPYIVNADTVPFATPAQTITGTSTTLAVNPADLYARENISAQTGLSNDVTAIPAPTASQSPWGVNLLGETLHYAPGIGWQIVSNMHQESTATYTNSAPTQGSWVLGATVTAPRAGKVIITGWAEANINNPGTGIVIGSAVGIAKNGSVIQQHNVGSISPVGTLAANSSSGNSPSDIHFSITYAGVVAAGDTFSAAGLVFSDWTIANNIQITYIA